MKEQYYNYVSVYSSQYCINILTLSIFDEFWVSEASGLSNVSAQPSHYSTTVQWLMGTHTLPQAQVRQSSHTPQYTATMHHVSLRKVHEGHPNSIPLRIQNRNYT